MNFIKSLFTLSLCALLISCAAPKVTFTLDDTENPTAIAVLKNGQTIGGIAKSYLRAEPTYIEIETANGNKAKYPASDVKTLTFKAKKAEEKDDLWIPATIEVMDFFKVKLSERPVFLRVTYDGTHVMALEVPTGAVNPHSPNAIGVMTQRRGAGTRFYYLIKGDNVARYYWYHDNISTPVGGKSILKKVFKDYPQVIKAIEDGRLNYKKDLTEFIRVMDKEWE